MTEWMSSYDYVNDLFIQSDIIKASYENSYKSVGWTADIEDVSKLIITVLSKIYMLIRV